MAIIGALDRTKHLEEFGDPLVTNEGVKTANVRKGTARKNLGMADVVNIGDVTTYTMLAENRGKTHVIPDLTADVTISLPTAASGLAYEFVYGGVAVDGADWVIDAGSDTNFFYGGLVHLDADAGSAGDEIAPVAGDGNSNSKLTVLTPNVGTVVRLICDGTNWFLSGFVVSNQAPTFADQ